MSKDQEPNPNLPELSRTGKLSSDELYQLTLWKWKYELEAYGFKPDQVQDLRFLK